ncbi:TRAP transporter substrate-binding protein [Oscillospiraceae bacterium PP1C4]
MNSKLTKAFSAVLAGAMSLTLLAGCGGAAKTDAGSSSKAEGGAAAKPAKTVTIKVGSVVAATHPMNVALREVFKKTVEEGSNGAIKVELYDSGTLGGEKELYDSVRNGNLDICSVGTVMWNEVDKMSIPDWPFLFRDVDHARKVYTGEIGAEMAKQLEEVGKVHFLGWGPNGARAFSSNRTINTLEDFKGLRLRMPNNPIHIQLGSLLGANVTPMPMGEVFTALEQKVVDGQDNPLATFRNEGWYEVQSDVFISNHMITSLEMMASDKLWKSLSEDQIKLVQEASLKTCENAWDLYVASIDGDTAFLKENGLKITVPDEATRAQLVELSQPIYDDLYKKYDWAEAMVKRIRDVK